MVDIAGSEANDEYQRRIASAVMKAVFDASLIEIDGKMTAYIRSSEVCAALITAMATIMEGAPPCRTAKGMREMSETAGRNLLTMMREMRKIREETGDVPFHATQIHPS